MPMSEYNAVHIALHMHEYGGFSYTQISWFMTNYHGHYRSADGWRRKLRMAGAPPRPHGRNIQENLRAVRERG